MEKILQFLNNKWLCCPWLLWWLRGKVSACDAGEEGLIPGLERSLEKEMSTHSRILEWERTEEPGMLSPQGCKGVEHNLVTKQQQNSKSSFVNTEFFHFFFLKIFICESFLKSLLNLLEYFFFCWGFFQPWCMWDPPFPIRNLTSTPFIGRQSLYHWTTKEVFQAFQFLLPHWKSEMLKPLPLATVGFRDRGGNEIDNHVSLRSISS